MDKILITNRDLANLIGKNAMTDNENIAWLEGITSVCIELAQALHEQTGMTRQRCYDLVEEMRIAILGKHFGKMITHNMESESQRFRILGSCSFNMDKVRDYWQTSGFLKEMFGIETKQ